MPKSKKVNRERPLKIYGSFDDVIKAAVKGNPKAKKKAKTKKV